jgi:hypothetical protein
VLVFAGEQDGIAPLDLGARYELGSGPPRIPPTPVLSYASRNQSGMRTAVAVISICSWRAAMPL